MCISAFSSRARSPLISFLSGCSLWLHSRVFCTCSCRAQSVTGRRHPDAICHRYHTYFLCFIIYESTQLGLSRTLVMNIKKVCKLLCTFSYIDRSLTFSSLVVFAYGRQEFGQVAGKLEPPWHQLSSPS